MLRIGKDYSRQNQFEDIKMTQIRKKKDNKNENMTSVKGDNSPKRQLKDTNIQTTINIKRLGSLEERIT